MWPWNKQPLPNKQRQVAGPAPNPASAPSPWQQMARNGIDAPFAGSNPNYLPTRQSEVIEQEQSATPLNGFLSERTTEEVHISTKYAHRIRAPRAKWREIPTAVLIAPFLAPDAYTSRRLAVATTAPLALQRSAGGLELMNYQLAMQNININLADMYKGATAPESASFTGQCQ